MNPEELAARVNSVIDQSGDDEAAHAMEDDLHLDIIRSFTPNWVQAEVARLCAAPFNRWTA